MHYIEISYPKEISLTGFASLNVYQMLLPFAHLIMLLGDRGALERYIRHKFNSVDG